MKHLCYLIAFLVMLASCNANEMELSGNGNVDPAIQIEITNSEKESIKMNNRFALAAWMAFSQANEGNQVFSPLSIQMAISMAANGASEHDRNRIVELFSDQQGNEGIDNLNTLNKTLIDILPRIDKRVKINIANSIWCDENLNFHNAFIEKTKEFYYSTSHKFQIGTQQAMRDINDWCAKETSGMISEFFKDSPRANALLINATYFNGTWKTPFDPAITEHKQFFCKSGAVSNTPMMWSASEYILSFENEDLINVVIPYGGATDHSGYHMNIYMPKDGVEFEKEIDKYLATENISEYEYHSNISLRIPKFHIESQIMLGEILKSMGYGDILQAIYPDILSEHDFFMDMILQKAAIDVNEEGTAAAAVTVIASAGGIPKNVTIDRPFIFTITEKSTGLIIYIGKVEEL